jgi:potassium-dependent mechanosensitive channel
VLSRIKTGSGSLRLSASWRLIILLAACTCPFGALRVVQAVAEVASPKAAETPAPSPTIPPQAIPLPDVAERVERLENSLKELEKEIVDSPADKALDAQLKARDFAIQEEATEAFALLKTAPSAVELRDLETVWVGHLRESRETQRTLKGRVEELQQRLRALNDEAVEWEATLSEFQDSGLENLNARLRDELSRIKTTRVQAQDRLHALLGLQYRISQQDAHAQDVIDRVQQERDQFRNRLFVRDSPPIWSPAARGPGTPIQAIVRSSFGREFQSSKAYVAAHPRLVSAIVAFFLVCLGVFFQQKRCTKQWLSEGILAEDDAHLLQRPLECALLLSLLALILLAKVPPLGILNAAGLLFLIPVLRLRVKRGRRLSRLVVWTLIVCYSVAQLDSLSRSSPFPKRIVSALGAVVVAALFIYLAERIRQGHYTSPHGLQDFVRVASYVVTALLVFSLGANVLGYVALSQIAGEATLHSVYVGAVLYTAFCVVSLTFETLLKTKRAQRIAAIRLRGDLIAHWGVRVIGFSIFVLWCFVTLSLFSIEDQVVAALRSMLESQLHIGSLNFTLGSILTFVLFLWLGFVFASAVRFLLREDVLPHFHLSRGIPNVISTLTYYLMVLAVFFMALAAGGVELNRFTLVTGAFGVGVGFGLQNVVNNFVSGLILLFERPIRVGDTIEVGGMSGEVKRLGVRSCTVLTAQGAEVIVPNSELIANKVINWTLSDQRRRVELPIGVAYGSDPERVMKLLLQVAEDEKRVMPEPKPVALFLGFGDSALNFELRFWVIKESEAVPVRSLVALAVAAALRKEGIEIPVPLRDLNVRSLPTNGAVQGGVESSEEARTFQTEPETRMTQKSSNPRASTPPPALPIDGA